MVSWDKLCYQFCRSRKIVTNWPVVERSRDLCGYCCEQHAQHLCGYCHEQHAQQLWKSIHFHWQTLLQTEVHSSFLPLLCLQNRLDLALTSCLFHFLRCLFWFFPAPIVVDSIRLLHTTYLLQSQNKEATFTRGIYHSHPWGLINTRKLYYPREFSGCIRGD